MDNLSNYVYRGQRTQQMPVPTPKRIVTPAGSRLSTIIEGRSHIPIADQSAHDDAAAESPVIHGGPNFANITNASRSPHHGIPPRASYEKRPPSYSADIEDGRKGFAFFRTRGGWKRLSLIILGIVLVFAIALGVGLGVGLSGKDNDNGSDASPANPSMPSTPVGPFPVGAYALSTFLTNTSTECTPVAETWRCYPYTVYSAAPSSSRISFNWYITQAENQQFQISSSDNAFSIMFTNVSLSLVDAGMDSERYFFSLQDTLKTVFPSVNLTDDQATTTCFYNQTTFQASLYTRRNSTLTADAGSGMSMPMQDTGSSGIVFNATWPGALEVQQVASGGNDVPNCFRLQNGRAVGDEIPLTVQSESAQCSCQYSNLEA